MDVLERFFIKVDKNGPRILKTRCWTWTAYVHKRTGYGRFYFEGKVVEAHSASYRMFVGPVPEGLELDHLCRNRACVRPDHLEPVPHATNMERGTIATVARAKQLAKTHCPQGHPYSGHNLIVLKGQGNARRCRTCQNEKRRVGNRTSETAERSSP